jgi:hypothetical protein
MGGQREVDPRAMVVCAITCPSSLPSRRTEPGDDGARSAPGRRSASRGVTDFWHIVQPAILTGAQQERNAALLIRFPDSGQVRFAPRRAP